MGRIIAYIKREKAKIKARICATLFTLTIAPLRDFCYTPRQMLAKNRLVRIGFIGDLSHKATRDRFSGLLRFIAEKEAPWDIKAIDPISATDVELLQFRNWAPVGIITNFENISVIAKRISGRSRWRHETVFVNRLNLSRRSARAMDIRIDDASLSEAAASLLMKRGLVNFAYVDELERYSETERSKLRGNAFVEFLARNGFACARFSSTINGTNWSNELYRLADWLKELPKPCGIMAYADICAKRIYDACRIARLRIPDQIRIVGVDNDISLCENLSPTLTSIEPDFERCGYLAGQLMFERLEKSSPAMPRSRSCGVKSIVERASTQDVKGGGRIVSAACEIIRLHASDEIGVADVAAKLNVSRRLLEMRFRDVLGTGVAEELRRVRLESVCRQLRSTNLPIGEISAKSGFSSSSHLNALFRKTYGMTMRDWRNTGTAHNPKP